MVEKIKVRVAYWEKFFLWTFSFRIGREMTDELIQLQMTNKPSKITR
jgi:hypothetical protein